MYNPIDRLINGITMYRLAIYELIALLAGGALLGFWHLVPFSPLMLGYSTLVIYLVCWAVNEAFARILKIPSNAESVIITALILACIITPSALGDLSGLAFMASASALAMACKYVIAVRKRHLFNPAAFGVAIAAFLTGGAASWWVGTLWLLPLTLIGGILVVRKMQRFDLVGAFLACGATMVVSTAFAGSSPALTLWKLLVHTPILFFASVMLTEPLTTPPGRLRRLAYGAMTGLLYAPAIHFGDIYSTPELALLVGNLLGWILAPQGRHLLRFKERIDYSPNISDLVFESDRKLNFRPGQYVEWTLSHRHADARGARRYFTVASSPSESLVHIGVRFAPDDQSSSFKRTWRALAPGQAVAISPPAGDFTLPRDASKKLVFVAGGIGITPFRSMLQDLLERGERRSITLLYSSRVAEDIAYADVFTKAEQQLGIRTVYTLTGPGTIAPTWQGRKGMLDAAMIAAEVPDYLERTFYLSGPHVMVSAFGGILRQMGVPRAQVKEDFFPGFA